MTVICSSRVLSSCFFAGVLAALGILLCGTSRVAGSPVVNSFPNPPEILTSPQVTDWGLWGEWERCPHGTFVMGMRLKLEPSQGPLDDTGLNGIQFHCGRIGESSKAIQSRRITSLVGNWGGWGNTYECGGGYAVGFQLRSEPELQQDNTGANNLRLFCSGSKGYVEGNGLHWGMWTDIQWCPDGKAICGLRTQVQPSQGLSPNADDTALNNLSVECCAVN